MSTIIDKIKDMGIPTNSYVAAAGVISTRFSNDSKSDYDYNIGVLTGRNIVTDNTKHAQLVFGYVVQESVRMMQVAKSVNLDEVIESAISKAHNFLIRNPWVQTATEQITEVAGEMVVTSISKKSKRSGPSKRDLCIALYDRVKDQNLARAELIALFVNELGLTPAGASTYVHNCKSGLWKK